jgi:RNA polymerase subunit RPABC4/transcription elongation factor Spt4
MIILPLIVYMMITVILCAKVYNSAKEYGMNAEFWVSVIIVMSIFGAILYWIVKPGKHPGKRCSKCGKVVEDDYYACPNCGNRFKEQCKNCESLIEKDFIFCPYCGKKKEQGK